MPVDTIAAAREVAERVIQWRRDIHQHPELGDAEHRTTALIVATLDRLGFSVTQPLPTGAVAEKRCQEPFSEKVPDTFFGFRADLDALPIQEANEDLPYRSQAPGVCHACGHDAHTAMLLGTAVILSQHRDALRRPVRLIFQPNEELLPGGAVRMVEAGVARDLAALFAFHVDPMLEAGKIEVRPGPMFAAADGITITVTGRGGHGALPHLCIDPIPVAAEIILALQTLVSRRIDPLQPAVLSICQVNAGTAFNIIPPEVRMVGTVRTLDEAVRRRVLEMVTETAQGIAAAAGATATVEVIVGQGVVTNDAATAHLAAERAARLFGPAALVNRPPLMGSEDFAYFTQHVPGCYMDLGVGNPSLGADAPHHSPHFRIDESALWMGPALFADLALNA